MSSVVLQRGDGRWYVHDSSISHSDLGPFQTRAAAEHYRDTGVDQEWMLDHSTGAKNAS